MRISDWSSDVCSSDLKVSQCGYCIPGVIMAASALLRRTSDPSDEEIDAAITNICRCGIYPRLRGAIQRAGRVMRGEEVVDAVPPSGIAPEEAAKIGRAHV